MKTTIATGLTLATKETKLMSSMKPCEVCVIVKRGANYGHIVMRTASVFGFEVMNLSDLKADNFWNEDDNHIKVVPYEGESITIKLKSEN